MVSFIRWTTSWENASRRSYSKMPLIPHMRGIRPCSRDAAAYSEIEIKAAVCIKHAAQAKRFDSVVPSRGAQLVNEGRITCQNMESISKPLSVSGCEQRTVDVVYDDFRIAADICCQDGQAGSHGFEQSIGHLLPERGEDENVHGVEKLGDAAGIAGKTNPALKIISCEGPEFFALGSGTNQQHTHIDPALGEQRGSSEKCLVILD